MQGLHLSSPLGDWLRLAACEEIAVEDWHRGNSCARVRGQAKVFKDSARTSKKVTGE